MQRLMVHGHDVEVTGELRAFIDARVGEALRPFGKQIGVVRVRLHRASDLPDARVSCQIRVELNPRGGVALGEFGGGARQAIERATRRITVALGRRIDHGHRETGSTDRLPAFQA